MTDTNVTAVAVETQAEVNFDEIVKSLKFMFVQLYPVVSGKTWTKWDLSDQTDLRETMAKINSVRSKLQPVFDSTIWDGHDDGSVDLSIESIRARRAPDSATPGRKPAVKSVDEVFDAL